MLIILPPLFCHSRYRPNDRAASSALLCEIQQSQPQQIFADGAFSPAQTSAVGYTLVRFMIMNGGAGKFGQFVARLRNGSSVDAAMQAVYRSDSRSIAIGYSKTLPKP